MAKTGFKTVDSYIAAQPPATQRALKKLRSIVRKALPDAEEKISYQIPAYRLHGTTVLFFAGWKGHYSLYPANNRFVTAFRDELAPYTLSRGTIRFELSEPVPEKLITRIAKFRAKEAAAKAEVSAPKPKNKIETRKSKRTRP
jgi:uncharacterized protein YdhG (YjbR/CyaY superfamily)